MSSTQRNLSEYLQAELYHTLGAYRLALEHLDDLAERLHAPAAPAGDDSPGAGELARLIAIVRDANVDLDRYRDDAHQRVRHPVPRSLPLTVAKRFSLPPASPGEGDEQRRRTDLRARPWVQPLDWAWVLKYYDAATSALKQAVERDGPPVERHHPDYEALHFADSLVAVRDSARRDEAGNALYRGRLERYDERRRQAFSVLSSIKHEDGFEAKSEFLPRIVTDNLSTGGRSLPFFVLAAQAEGHMLVHAVEAWQSLGLDLHSRLSQADKDWLRDELDRSIALSTFAYSVGRAAPWVFAEDDEERQQVFERHPSAWDNLVPTRCMWISTQVTLLSLHRRAYAYGLRGQPERSYNDYHKLQRQIRDAERRVRRAPVHVRGAFEFLAALSAQAHHHAGELYRKEHAHTRALTHFRTAEHRLSVAAGDGQATELHRVLGNSRWQVQLQISRGKACYEIGHHKEALAWYLRAWAAFLYLLSEDTETQPSTQDVVAAIEWLDDRRFEPEFRKQEISDLIDPVIAQLDGIVIDRRLGTLAGEIMLRLGHLLLILNLDGHDGMMQPPRFDRLAYGCLAKAAECDPFSTLVGADLLKIRAKGGKAEGAPRKWPVLKPVGEQWPMGGDDYERLARVTEYLLLEAVCEPDRGVALDEDLAIATELLLHFFTHTDSINVRKSQAHRFLTRDRRPPSTSRGPAVELVCVRRYSSAFPLLPRPSAFRALGGGYFVVLHSEDGSSFGIVVDPGVDFIENLYRAGRSLSDIDMIVVTHDHVDHLGALDPLLSLLYARADILSDENPERHGGEQTLPVVVNESVFNRYESVERLRSKNEFLHLSDFEAGAFVPGCPEFELVAVPSTAGAPQRQRSDGQHEPGGHIDLGGSPAYGVCFRAIADGASVAITGDVPAPPPPDQRDEWRALWQPMLDADLLVAHLSTVPLAELRKLMELDASGCGQAEQLSAIRARLQQEDPTLQGRLEFSFWLRSAGVGDTAGLVCAVPESWRPRDDHLYLAGLLAWAREYRDRDRDGLFVVGELSEELGTLRGKIAHRLNTEIFRSPQVKQPRVKALTADIGLCALVHRSTEEDHPSGPPIGVLCTICNLDNDRAQGERRHEPRRIREVCVKGENEGIFYNCREHDPGRRSEKTFLERLERFDVFGR